MKLIALSAIRNCKNKGKFYAKVDDEDYEYLSKFYWFASQTSATRLTCYAVRCEQKDGHRKNHIRMHREIMMLHGLLSDENIIVDHKDHNGLNNQKSNLRACSHAQNIINRRKLRNKKSSSKYIGVSRYGNKWKSVIYINRNRHQLGIFDTEIEAAIKYNNAVSKYRGEFGYLNNINV